MNNFINSWKTSLCGIFGGVLTMVANVPHLQAGTAKDWAAAFASALMVTSIGFFSKDADKTGVK